MEDLDIVFPDASRNESSETQLGAGSLAKKDVRFVLSTHSAKLQSPPSPPGLLSEKDTRLRVDHGPIKLVNYPVKGTVNCATFNPITRMVVVVGPEGVAHFLSEDGQVVDVHRIGYPVNNLLLSDDGSNYIGWVSGEPQLVVTTDDMKKAWSMVCSEPVVDVICCSANVISADTKDVVSRWRLASDGRGLVLKQKLSLLERHQECARSGTLVVCLAVGFEDKVCYAAVGQEVAEVDFNSGTVVYQPYMHNSRITAMMSLIQHKLLATGSKDGLIKVWSEDGELMSLFSGHTGPVVALALCPLPKTVMSSSLDRTVRFWKLDAIDEFSRLTMMSVVKMFLIGDSRTNQFFFVTDQAVSLWTVDELYTPLTVLRSPIQLVGPVSLEVITPYLPVCLSNRCALAINVLNGNIVSAVDVTVVLKDIVQCRTQDLLFMLVKDGCTVVRAWCRDKMIKPKYWRTAIVEEEALTCLLVYEHSSEGIASSEVGWSQRETRDTALLFAGRADGAITWLNMNTCYTLGIFKGHAGAIIRLACCASVGRLASLSEEKILELWQVLPSQERVLVSLVCLQPQVDVNPVIAVAPHSLAVATVNEGLLIYHFKMKRFISPLPESTCTASIRNIAALDTLFIFATSVEDKTIRIWTECNELLRVVGLDQVPSSVAFSSWGGDIVFTFKRHVLRLPANRYLPRNLLAVSRKVMLKQLGISEVLPSTSPLSPSARCTSDDSISQEDFERQVVCSPQGGHSITHFRGRRRVSSLKTYAESVAGILFPTADSTIPIKQARLVASYEGPQQQRTIPSSKHFFPIRTMSCPNDCFYDTDSVRGGLIPNSVLVKILWPDDISGTEEQKLRPSPIVEEPTPKEKTSIQVIGRRLQELAFVRCPLSGYSKDSEHLQVIHVLFTRRPSALKEADISWLPLHEQTEILTAAGKDWKVIRIKVVYGSTAKATLKKVSKVIYSTRKEAYLDLMPTAGKSGRLALKILEQTLSLKQGIQLMEPKLPSTSELKPRFQSTPVVDSISAVKESDTRISDTCARVSLLPADEDTRFSIAKSMKEFVKFLSRCANAVRMHRCSKKDVAVALSTMGVHDPNGLLIEEMDDWLREVKAQLAGDKLGILRETIESWLKRWTIRYITHVLAMVQDLQRGHLSGHVRLNMLQMILEHNKGHVLDASPQRESTAYAFSAYNPLGDETLSLAVTCPSSLNQSLVDTVTPVEVVNYFCEMCIDEQHYFCEHGLFKSNLTSGKQIPICSDTLTHGTSPSLKEVGRQNLFGPWPTGIHLPLKMANVVLFRDKTSHLPSELLSYQTCDKFFVPDKSYT